MQWWFLKFRNIALQSVHVRIKRIEDGIIRRDEMIGQSGKEIDYPDRQ